MSREEYMKFINTGAVSKEILLDVAKKVSVHANLDMFDYAVFTGCLDKINRLLIKNKNKNLEQWDY